MGIVTAVANQKGGVGKTTTAINLSACLAASGRKVLLVDIDPQGNATSGLGVEKKRDMLSVYELITQGRGAYESVCATQVQNLFLIPSAMRLAGAEVELISMDRREQMLKRAILPLSAQFDDILIDCPPSLSLLTLNALTCAHALLIPIQCEFYALEGLSQLMDTVKRVREHYNPTLHVEGVVMTMYDMRTNLSAQVADEVKRYYGDRVFSSYIPRNVRLAEAPSYGLPITLYDPFCPGARAYHALCAEILQKRGVRI